MNTSPEMCWKMHHKFMHFLRGPIGLINYNQAGPVVLKYRQNLPSDDWTGLINTSKNSPDGIRFDKLVGSLQQHRRLSLATRSEQNTYDCLVGSFLTWEASGQFCDIPSPRNR